MPSYFELPGLSDVYFEDSWVLEVSATERSAMLLLDLVLTESHPAWQPAKPGEQYCYRRACLRFDDATSVLYRPSALHPTTDATGEIDFGNIDAMTLDDEGYHLEGDWGTLQIDGPAPALLLV